MIEKNRLQLIKNENGSMPFALAAIVLLLMAVFAGAYFAKLNVERQEKQIQKTRMKSLNQQIYNIRSELRSSAQEAGYKAIDLVESNLLSIQGKKGIGERKLTEYIKENTTRLFNEYYRENFKGPIRKGDKYITTHLYPLKNPKDMKLGYGKVKVLNGTEREWIDSPLFFTINRTVQVNIYDNTTDAFLSKKIHIDEKVETSFFLMGNLMDKFRFQNVAKITSSMLYTLAYCRIFSSDVDRRTRIGYKQSIFDKYGLHDQEGLFNIINNLRFIDFGSKVIKKLPINKSEGNEKTYYNNLSGNFMKGFQTDVGNQTRDKIISKEDVEICYNIGLILEQMRVFQNYDEDLIDKVINKINSEYPQNIQKREFKNWLGDGPDNFINVEALSIKLFSSTGVIDDQLFTAGPFLKKYGDEGFMDLVTPEWWGTFFATIVKAIDGYGESIGEFIGNIENGLGSAVYESLSENAANLGYIKELLSFSATALGHTLKAFHFNSGDLKKHIKNKIINEWLWGLNTGWFNIEEKIAGTIVDIADDIGWLFKEMGLKVTGAQLLYIMVFGPFGDEDVGNKTEQENAVMDVINNFFEESKSYLINKRNDYSNDLENTEKSINRKIENWNTTHDNYSNCKCSEIKSEIIEAKNEIYNGDWFSFEDPKTENYKDYVDSINEIGSINELHENCTNDDRITSIKNNLGDIEKYKYKKDVYKKIKNHFDKITGEDDYDKWKEYINFGENNNDAEKTENCLKILSGNKSISTSTESLAFELDQSNYGIDDFKEIKNKIGSDDKKNDGKWTSKIKEIARDTLNVIPNYDDPTGGCGLFSLFDRVNSNMADMTKKGITNSKGEGRLESLLKTGKDIKYEDSIWDGASTSLSVDNVHGTSVNSIKKNWIASTLGRSWNKIQYRNPLTNWIRDDWENSDPFEGDIDSNWKENRGKTSFYNLGKDVVHSMEEKVPKYLEKIENSRVTFTYPNLDTGDTSEAAVVHAPKAPIKIKDSEGSKHKISIDDIDFSYVDIADSLTYNTTGIRNFRTLNNGDPGKVMTSYLNPFSTKHYDYYMTSFQFDIDDKISKIMSISSTARTLVDNEKYVGVTFKKRLTAESTPVSTQLYTPLPAIKKKYKPNTPLQVKVKNVQSNRNVFNKTEKETMISFEDRSKQTDFTGGDGYEDKGTHCTYRVSVVAMVDNKHVPAHAQSVINLFSSITGSDKYSNYKRLVNIKVKDNGDKDLDKRKGYVKTDVTSYLEDNWTKITSKEGIGGSEIYKPMFITRIHKQMSFGYMVSAKSVNNLCEDDDYTDPFVYSPTKIVNEQVFVFNNDKSDHISVFNVSTIKGEATSPKNLDCSFSLVTDIPSDSWLVKRDGIPFLVDFENHTLLRDTLAAQMAIDKTLSNEDKKAISIACDILPVPQTTIESLVTLSLPDSEYKFVRAYDFIPVIKSRYNEERDEIVRYPEKLIPVNMDRKLFNDNTPLKIWGDFKNQIVNKRKSFMRVALDPKLMYSVLGAIPSAIPGKDGGDEDESTKYSEALDSIGINKKNSVSYIMEKIPKNSLFDKQENIFDFEEGLDFMQGAYVEYYVGANVPDKISKLSSFISLATVAGIGIYKDGKRALEIGQEIAEIALTVATCGAYSVASSTIKTLETMSDVLSTARDMLDGASQAYSELKGKEDLDFEEMKSIYQEGRAAGFTSNRIIWMLKKAYDMVHGQYSQYEFYNVLEVFYDNTKPNRSKTQIYSDVKDSLEFINDKFDSSDSSYGYGTNNTLRALISIGVPITPSNIEDICDEVHSDIKLYNLDEYGLRASFKDNLIDDLENIKDMIDKNGVHKSDIKYLISENFELDSLFILNSTSNGGFSLRKLVENIKIINTTVGFNRLVDKINSISSLADWNHRKEKNYYFYNFINYTVALEKNGDRVEIYPFGQNNVSLMVNDEYVSYIYSLTSSVSESVNEDLPDGIDKSNIRFMKDWIRISMDDIDGRGRFVIQYATDTDMNLNRLKDIIKDKQPYNSKVSVIEIYDENGNVTSRIKASPTYIIYNKTAS